jgi:hypothetical protein
MGLLNKFPSFQQLQTNAVGAIRRFPLTLLSAVVGTVAAIILIEDPDDNVKHLLEKLIMVAYLGLPLFIALTLLAEKRQWRRQVAFAGQAVGVILLVAYFFSLPEGVEDVGSCMMRFALLSIGLHFLVACLPYIGGIQTHGFWQYNMSLLHRFLTAAVFSGVMYVGLGIALAAADELFGYEVKPERYFQLFTIMVGVFNTWLFLAGVPDDLEALDRTTDYPKGLAVFAQYILLPLVALYFVILIAYEAKIIIDWNWPIGWVSELVLWFSVVGILSLLLLYPLRKQAEKRWVQTFVKWFFRGLVLLVPLLLLAILRRISDYGVTEPRYLVLIMAVGLVIVTLYFLIRKARDIRIIPILLATGAFLAAYGPWSASAVSLWSQQGRLETLLTQNGLLVDGSIQEAEQEPSFEDRKQMSSIIDYVIDWHGPEPFERWLGEGVVESLETQNQYAQKCEITEQFGIKPLGPHDSPEPASIFSISAYGDRKIANLYAVTGFDYLVDFSLQTVNGFQDAFPIETDSCFVSFDMDDLVLDVAFGNDRDDNTGAMRFQLSDALDSLIVQYDDKKTPVGDRSFVISGDVFEVKLVLEYVYGEKKDGDVQLGVFVGHLLLRRH